MNYQKNEMAAPTENEQETSADFEGNAEKVNKLDRLFVYSLGVLFLIQVISIIN